MQRGARQGPCGCPTCPDFDNPTGQWQFIPQGFSGEVVREASCTCKKASCRRYFGLLPEPQKPGKLGEANSGSVPVGDNPPKVLD